MRLFGNARVQRLLLLIVGFGGSMVVGSYLLGNAADSIQCVSTEPIFAIEQIATVPPIESAEIKLPYQIPGTELIAQQLCVYEGPFLEDGSGEEVVNTAALLLTNISDAGTERTQVTLRWKQGEYVFNADMIPAGASVLVLEQDRKNYAQQNWTACIGWQILATTGWSNCYAISVVEEGYGTLAVTNHSEHLVKDVCLYYKSKLQEPEIYIGGITYKAGIGDLTPGQTVRLELFHYACGYSGVIYYSAIVCPYKH